MDIYFLLIRARETTHETNSAVFISSLIFTHSANPDCLQLTGQGRIGKRRNYGWPCLFPSLPSFSAYVICKYRKITQKREAMTSFLGHSCFLECHCPLFAFEAICFSRLPAPRLDHTCNTLVPSLSLIELP